MNAQRLPVLMTRVLLGMTLAVAGMPALFAGDDESLDPRRAAILAIARDYATHAAWRLRKIAPGQGRGDFDTSAAASGLARMMSLLVHQKWESGEFLCIEWAIDQLLGNYVQRHAHFVSRIHHALVRGRHDHRNRFDFGWGDNYAYFVDVPLREHDDSANGFVLEGQSRSVLILDVGRVATGRTIHARWVRTRWHREGLSLKKWRECGFRPNYGDCRDEGYVLSCRWGLVPMAPSVDRGHQVFGDVTHLLWWLRMAHDALGLKGDEQELND